MIPTSSALDLTNKSVFVPMQKFMMSDQTQKSMGTNPHTIVATTFGWRSVDDTKCPWTGTSAKHARERAVRVHVHADWLKAHNHRCTLMERHRSQTFEGLSVSQAVDAPLASICTELAEEHGATKAACQT